MESVQGLGISLSGGGLRAASFGLGCLQELDARHAVLSGPEPTQYLAAVSGGSYTAAAVSAVLAAESQEPSTTARSRPLAPGSAEARLLAERSNYFLRHGRFALTTDVVALVLASAIGLASAVLFPPALVSVWSIQSWLIPKDELLADALSVIGLLAGAAITAWAVHSTPVARTRRRLPGLLAATLVMLGTAPSVGSLVNRVEPLSGPTWWLHRWPALLVAGFVALGAALALQRRDESEKRSTGRARLGGAGLAALRWTTLALAVLVPVWAVAVLVDLEFPRFGGQGLITQPRWLVSL